MDRDLAIDTLKRFCSFPLKTSVEVLKAFADLPGAISHFDSGKHNFVYVPGTRQDRVLLVAHADTVWDEEYTQGSFDQVLIEKSGSLYGKNMACGIGADDRSGCAILWLLRNSGHSLLITDGEEIGSVASKHIISNYPSLFLELNEHCYMVQFDRRNFCDYKVYNLPVSQDFIEFIEKSTGYCDAGKKASTDIVKLCRDICGVNLSVGYYNEHTPNESIVIDEWLNTLEIAEKMLSGPQRQYLLDK